MAIIDNIDMLDDIAYDNGFVDNSKQNNKDVFKSISSYTYKYSYVKKVNNDKIKGDFRITVQYNFTSNNGKDKEDIDVFITFLDSLTLRTITLGGYATRDLDSNLNKDITYNSIDKAYKCPTISKGYALLNNFLSDIKDMHKEYPLVSIESSVGNRSKSVKADAKINPLKEKDIKARIDYYRKHISVLTQQMGKADTAISKKRIQDQLKSCKNRLQQAQRTLVGKNDKNTKGKNHRNYVHKRDTTTISKLDVLSYMNSLIPINEYNLDKDMNISDESFTINKDLKHVIQIQFFKELYPNITENTIERICLLDSMVEINECLIAISMFYDMLDEMGVDYLLYEDIGVDFDKEEIDKYVRMLELLVIEYS